MKKLLFISLLFSFTAKATVYTLSATSGFITISQTTEGHALVAGDVIRFNAAGSYTGFQVQGLNGSAGNNITIDGNGAIFTASSFQQASWSNVNYVTLTGITWQNCYIMNRFSRAVSNVLFTGCSGTWNSSSNRNNGQEFIVFDDQFASPSMVFDGTLAKTFHDIRFTASTFTGFGNGNLMRFGTLWGGADDNRSICVNIEIDHCTFSTFINTSAGTNGNELNAMSGTVFGMEFHHNTIGDIASAASGAFQRAHIVTLQLWGNGHIYNNKQTNSYAQLVRGVPLKWTGLPNYGFGIYAYNNIIYQQESYGPFEFGQNNKGDRNSTYLISAANDTVVHNTVYSTKANTYNAGGGVYRYHGAIVDDVNQTPNINYIAYNVIGNPENDYTYAPVSFNGYIYAIVSSANSNLVNTGNQTYPNSSGVWASTSTFQPDPSSPLLNAGGSYSFRTYDFYDAPLVGGADVGAVERQPSSYAAKIYQLYDFPYGSSDQNSPYKLFDGNTATVGTPRVWQDYYGMDTVIGANGIRHPFIKWGRNRGWIDLSGFTDRNDTSHNFRVASVRAYSSGSEAGHKVYFFNGNKILRATPHQRYKMIARPDLYLTPFDSITSTSTNGWTTGNMTVPEDCRYVFMIIQGNKSTFTYAKLSEIEILGTYQYDTVAFRSSIRPPMYTGSLAVPKDTAWTMFKRNGVDWFNGMGPLARANDGKIRLFWGLNYSDTTAASGIPSTYKYAYNAFSDINTAIIRTIKGERRDIYFTNQDASTHIGNNGGGAINIDAVGLDPSGLSWYRDADYYYHLTKAMGSVTTGAANKFGVANGQNLVTMTGTGNEVVFGRGMDNLDVAMKMNFDYDGYEDSIKIGGLSTGIKHADPNMKMLQPAMIDLDTLQIATQSFYGEILRYDKAYPADVIEFHKYLDITDSLGGIQRGNEQKIDSRSATPEEAFNSTTGLDKGLDTAMRRIRKFINKPIIWGETGRSKFGTLHAANETIAGYYDQSRTPGFGSYDSTQAVAVLNIREVLITQNSAVNYHLDYAMMNQTGGTISYPDRFNGMGRGSNYNGSTFEADIKFPYYYVYACVQGRMKDYVFDSVIARGGTTGLWVYRFRKMSTSNVVTDSVCYVAWHGSRSGQSATRTINMTGVSSAIEVVPSFVNETGTATSLTSLSNSASRTITELPTMYFAREVVATGAPSCTTNNATTSITYSGATLNWNAAATATGYKVYLWLNGGSTPSTPTYTTGGTTLTVSDLVPLTVYRFYVQPYNSFGDATSCTTAYSTFLTLSGISVWKIPRKH